MREASPDPESLATATGLKSAVARSLFTHMSVSTPVCSALSAGNKVNSPESASELARVQEALRQSEASRRESQAFFERSFHGNPTLMSITSVDDGRILEVNPSLLRASGYTREEIVGRTTGEIGIWVDDEQRNEFSRRLEKTGAVRDLEADFRTKSGALRSILVNADIIDLDGRKCMLTVGFDVTERRRRENIQAATYEISQAVLGSNDLITLLAKVHQIIGKLVPAKNFYVALLNADRSIVSFPYFVDERTPQPPSRPPRNGLTEFVIETRQPLLAGHEEILGRSAIARELFAAGKPFGAMAWRTADGRWTLLWRHRRAGLPQSVNAYTDDDMRLMLFVAEQTAAAIHRAAGRGGPTRSRGSISRRVFTRARRSWRSRASTDGLITEANPAFLRGIGYTREEVIGRTTLEIGLVGQRHATRRLPAPAPAGRRGARSCRRNPQQDRPDPDAVHQRRSDRARRDAVRADGRNRHHRAPAARAGADRDLSRFPRWS